MSLGYEPSLDPLHISAKQLFSDPSSVRLKLILSLSLDVDLRVICAGNPALKLASGGPVENNETVGRPAQASCWPQGPAPQTSCFRSTQESTPPGRDDAAFGRPAQTSYWPSCGAII